MHQLIEYSWGHIWGHRAKPEQHSPISSNYLHPQFNRARLHHLGIPGRPKKS